MLNSLRLYAGTLSIGLDAVSQYKGKQGHMKSAGKKAAGANQNQADDTDLLISTTTTPSANLVELSDTHAHDPLHFLGELMHATLQQKTSNKIRSLVHVCDTAIPVALGLNKSLDAELDKHDETYKKAKEEANSHIISVGAPPPPEPKRTPEHERALVIHNLLNDYIRLMESLKANANNKRFYTDAYFQQKFQALQALYAQLQTEHGNPEPPGRFFTALQDIQKGYTQEFAEKGPGRAFDANANAGQIIKSKGVKGAVRITDNGKPPGKGQQVIGVFDYNVNKIFARRKSLNIGPRNKKNAGYKLGKFTESTAHRERQKLYDQTSDFVMVVLNDYSKGTADNPIQLGFVPPNEKRPELALAMLLAYKKQAFERGTDLQVTADGKDYTISCKSMAIQDAQEAELFLKYAQDYPHRTKLNGQYDHDCAWPVSAGAMLFSLDQNMAHVDGNYKKAAKSVDEGSMLGHINRELESRGNKLGYDPSALPKALEQVQKQDNTPAPKAPSMSGKK